MMLLVYLFLSVSAPAKPSPYAQVLSVSGLVSVEPLHTNLKKGAELSVGDRLSVMSGSRVRMRLENGVIVELGDHTEAAIERDARERVVLRISHGVLLAASKDGAPLEVRSGAVKVHFSGRELVFEARGDKPTFVSIGDGDARVNWGGGSASVSGPGAVRIHPDRPQATAAKPRIGDGATLKALRALL